MRAKLLLCLALVATTALYWPGLSGPFLFDDYWNLGPLEAWYAGKQSWISTMLPNSKSIVFSRPVSMASFMLTTWIGGIGPFPYKLGNLATHLLCGVVGWWMLRRALREDPKLSPYAEAIAAISASLWLLHPLHVSTVLYAVQRMAQLSTLFTLAAVGIYLVARRQLIAGRTRTALLNLFLTFPLLLACGILSKQNAAIAPFLCLVFELAYFTDKKTDRSTLRAFFGLFVLLPTLAVALLLTIAPQSLLGGYAEWDFTLGQRLLTQPRALMDYLGMLLLPRGPLMGLFTDDFQISSGLFSPITTLLSIAALCVISGAAIALRKRAPSIFAGWFFFLVAHAVESTFLPLEMYYEHRNYLPSFGLALAIPGLWTLIPKASLTNAVRPARFAQFAAVGFALVLGFATLGRSLVWQDDEGIIAQGVKQHPESLRALLDSAVLALRKQDYERAAAITAPLRESDTQRHRVIGHLQRIAVDCMRGTGADRQDMVQAVKDAMPKLTVFEVQMARLLVNVSSGPRNGCGTVTAETLGDGFVGLLDAASAQPEASPCKHSIRMIASQMYARAGRWQDAEKQAYIAWKASGQLPVAALLVRFYVKNDKRSDAEALLGEMKRRIRPFDRAGNEELANLNALLSPTGAARH